ncbi:MAG: GNAT family N-acetyltransferase [Bacteroidales bacterium]|nr:GNAT family N-acetyltransferase [Bacteroidales bacterium]
MEIKRASEFGKDIRKKITELYVEGFYDDFLKNISNDKAKIREVYSPMFPVEYFYVAVIDNEIAGMVACLGRGEKCLNIDRRRFIKNFGFIKGLAVYFAYKGLISETNDIDDNTAILEFVVTGSAYRGKGVASSIFKHIFASSGYKNFQIGVANNNPGAFELYKKMGFEETHRIRDYFTPGIKYWIQLKHTKQ